DHDQFDLPDLCLSRMLRMALAVLAFGLTTCFMSGAQSAPCHPFVVDLNVTFTADIQKLSDALACAGEGIFNIKWYSSLAIDEMIEVSDGKHVTVTGDALGDDNAVGPTIDAGSSTGIFSVSDRSTLRLNNMVLREGNAEKGGAVAVRSSSDLFVFGCTFTRNNASKGGEAPPLSCDACSECRVKPQTHYSGAILIYGLV
ncbi:MAG: hypothetical protein ABJQ14_08715, partial [Hyphomicrobiales bacterium]